MSVFYFDKTFAVYRLRPKGTDRSAFSATFTSYLGSIQPTPVSRLNQNDRVGKHFTAYVDETCPVKEGDEIVVGTSRYAVQGVSDFDFTTGMLAHKKLELVL